MTIGDLSIRAFCKCLPGPAPNKVDPDTVIYLHLDTQLHISWEAIFHPGLPLSMEAAVFQPGWLPLPTRTGYAFLLVMPL